MSSENATIVVRSTGIRFYAEFDVTGRFHPYAPSLDRIDPKRGYTPDNVRLVVFAINTMLLDWGADRCLNV